MPKWKLDPVFVQHVMGASESYITGEQTSAGLATLFQNLIDRRSALLFRDYHKMVGWRATRLADDPNEPQSGRESRPYLPGDNELDSGGKINIPASGGATEATGFLTPPDQFRAVLQYRVKFGTASSSIRYLRGIPDGVSRTEPGTIKWEGNTGWRDEFTAFGALLVASFYVLALSKTGDYAPIKVKKLSLAGASPSPIVVSVLTSEAKPIGVGDFIKLAGFRRKKDKPGATLNGRYYVDGVSTTLFTNLTSYTLRMDPVGDPNDFKILGKARKEGWAYQKITKVDPYRIGIRQAGRPSLAPRGRRVTRLSLDP